LAQREYAQCTEPGALILWAAFGLSAFASSTHFTCPLHRPLYTALPVMLKNRLLAAGSALTS
jgi:hypothetical protein